MGRIPRGNSTMKSSSEGKCGNILRHNIGFGYSIECTLEKGHNGSHKTVGYCW